MSGRDAGSDVEALRVTRAEYRTVLDHQIALLNELDSKAMWSARTAIILLGLLVTAFGIAGSPVLAGLPTGATIAFGAGSVGLALTVVVGVGTYTASMPRFGVGANHHEEIISSTYSEREWLELLLDEYDKWHGEMAVAVDAKARQVFGAQFLLLSSLAVLFTAVTLMTARL